jgi:transposase-like protein
MIFSRADLLDEQESLAWVEKYFHPHGLKCPACCATTTQARVFRRHKRGLVDYGCQQCHSAYNLYTGTIFAGSHLDPRRVVLLLRGVCQGEPSTVLAEDLVLSRQSIHKWRQRIQPQRLSDVESDSPPKRRDRDRRDVSATRGKKGEKHADPLSSAAPESEQAARARHL